MKRKLLSIFLAFAMSVSLLTVGASAVEPTYGDVAGHWAEASIDRWSGHGIIQGNNGKFNPNGQLTCAHFAAILARLLKRPPQKTRALPTIPLMPGITTPSTAVRRPVSSRATSTVP